MMRLGRCEMASQVVIVGCGASGMMAAIFAARQGALVTVIERKPKPGVKLSITGKGRCNITNACPIDELIANVPTNGRFLYSAFSFMDSAATMALFESMGVSLTIERGRRVFPASDSALQVIGQMYGELRRLGVRILLGTRVEEVAKQSNGQFALNCGGGRAQILADGLILATGGLSYPRTGSTGDGHRIAAKFGHTIEPLRPALVPLEVDETWVPELQGLSLKNVLLKSPFGQEFGELMFTHFGITGPIVLSQSSHLTGKLTGENVSLSLDLKPALSIAELDNRLQKDFALAGRKFFGNSLGGLLPASLIPIVVRLSAIPHNKPANQVTRTERERLGHLLKDIPLTVVRTRPIEEAIVTGGGIKTSEVDPRTMESRLVKGLHFAGELLDVDGYTGGYNLQIAWSTGALAGKMVATEN